MHVKDSRQRAADSGRGAAFLGPPLFVVCYGQSLAMQAPTPRVGMLFVLRTIRPQSTVLFGRLNDQVVPLTNTAVALQVQLFRGLYQTDFHGVAPVKPGRLSRFNLSDESVTPMGMNATANRPLESAAYIRFRCAAAAVCSLFLMSVQAAPHCWQSGMRRCQGSVD